MSIRYDEYVKKPGEELQYDLNMIQELDSASNNIFDFIKHIKIVSLDHGRINFNPYDYQREMINLFDKNRKVIVLASRQSGKCVCANSMISVRNKKTGEIEEISIKDFFDRFDKDD